MSGGDRAESWSEYLRRIEKTNHRGILLKYNRTVKSTEIQSGVVRLVSTDSIYTHAYMYVYMHAYI